MNGFKNCCFKRVEKSDMKDFRVSVWSSKRSFDLEHDLNTIRFSIESSTFSYIYLFSDHWRAMTWCMTCPRYSGGTLTLESWTTRWKFWTRKECFTCISLSAHKSELRWMCGFQDMYEKVKIVCGDEARTNNFVLEKYWHALVHRTRRNLWAIDLLSLTNLAPERHCVPISRLSQIWSLKIGHFNGVHKVWDPIRQRLLHCGLRGHSYCGYSINCFTISWDIRSPTLRDAFRTLE
jgi:hypothetical protein